MHEAVSPKPRTYTGSKHDPYIFSSVYPVSAVLYRNLHLDGARKPERTSDDHPCTAFDCTADRRNRNLFQKYLSANICLLFVVLVLAYCGGGLLPDVLLPKVIQQIRPYLPGTYVMQIFCHALY